MVLKFSGVIEDCKYAKPKLPDFAKEWPKEVLDRHKAWAKLKQCSVLVYEPVLKYTFD